MPGRRLRAPSLRVALIAGALCALALAWISEGMHQRTAQAFARIETADAVRLAVHTVQRELAQAESSQRGYILTGDRSYLAPYQPAIEEIARQLALLAAMAPRRIADSDAMRAFRDSLARKLDEMTHTIRLREQGRAEAARSVISSNLGLEQMQALQAQADALATLADAELVALRDNVSMLLTISRLSVGAGILAAFAAFFLYVRQGQAQRQAQQRQNELLAAARDTLESEVRERTRDLTELASYLQDAVEKERARLARELHDELGALMTAAKLDVARLKPRLPAGAPELAERLQHLNQTLNEAIALKRRIMDNLHPSTLSNLGLVPALEILAREFSQHAGVHVQATLDAVDLDADRALTVYRMVQEALTNVGRHAGASEVTVRLAGQGNVIEVAVTDNGRGFDPTRPARSSHGLAGMRHRLRAIGGELRIDSAAGRGTRIVATIPAEWPGPPDAVTPAAG